MVNADGRSRDAAEAADHDAMDSGWLETVTFWSKVAAVTFAVLAALGTGVAVYFSSRMVAAKQADLERQRAASTLAIAAAEANAARAVEDAAAAHAAVAAANERAAQLELEAIRDRAAPARAEVSAAVAPTTTTPSRWTYDQRQAMVSLLKRTRGARAVELSWAAQTEPYAIARDVRGVLQDAGWIVRATGGVLSSSPQTGICLTTSVLSDDALLVQRAFEAGDLRLRIVLEPGGPEDQLKLTIGARADAECE
jgi:hypothetical protein